MKTKCRRALNNGYLYYFELNKNRTELALEGRLSDRVANNPNEVNTSKINNEGIIFWKGFGGVTDIEVGPDGIYIMSR